MEATGRRRGWASALAVASPVLVAAAVSTAFFRRIFLGPKVLVSIDFLVIHIPMRSLLSRIWHAGQIPAWTSSVWLGMPVIANGDAAALYPFQFPFFLMDHARAIGAVIWLHSILTVLTTAAFLRLSVGTSRPASLVGGLVFAFNGYQLVHLGLLGFVYLQPWVPLLFLAVERSASKGLLWAWAGMLAVALALLSGQPQHLYFSACLLPAFILLVTLRRPPEGRRQAAVRGVVGAAASAIGGAMLAAAQVLPQSELIRQTPRGGEGLPFADATFAPLPTSAAARILLPDYGRTFVGENAGWIGVVAVILVILGVIRLVRSAGRRAEAVLWLAMAATALVLALGAQTPLYRVVLAVVPGISRFRFPVRWLYPMLLALVPLVAIGVDAVLDGSSRLLPRLFTRGRVIITGLVVAVVVTAGGLVVSGQLDRWIAGDDLGWASAVGVALLALAAVVGSRAPTAVTGGVVVLAVLVELFAASAPLEWNQLSPPDAYATTRPIPDHIKAQGGGRVLSIYPPVGGDWSTAINRLSENTGLLVDIPATFGAGGAMPLEQASAVFDVADPRDEFAYQGATLELVDPEAVVASPELWRVLGTRWVVGAQGQAGLEGNPELIPAVADFERRLYELAQPGPRASAVCSARFVPDAREMDEVVTGPEFRATELVLEGERAPVRGPAGPACGTAEVVAETSASVRVRTRLEQPGWLLLADAWYPGWRAEADGRPVGLLRADSFLRAVPLPAGEAEVVFRYRPRSLILGGVVSTLTAVAWLVSLLWVARRRGA